MPESELEGAFASSAGVTRGHSNLTPIAAGGKWVRCWAFHFLISHVRTRAPYTLFVGLFSEVRKVCEFGLRLVHRQLAPSRERLGIAESQRFATSSVPQADGGPMDPREASQRREVMVKALWTLRTVMIDCDEAKAKFVEDGVMDVAMQAAATSDEELREAALASVAVAVTLHEGNCRYLLERVDLLGVLLDIAGPGEEGSGSPGKRSMAAPPSTNAAIAHDIL